MNLPHQEETGDNAGLSMSKMVVFRGYLNRMRQLINQYIDETKILDEEGQYIGPLLGALYNLSIANSIVEDLLINESQRTSYIPSDNDIEQSTAIVSTQLDDLVGEDVDKLITMTKYLEDLIHDFLLMIVKEKYTAVIPGRYLSNIEMNLQEAKYNVQFELNELNNDEI